MTIFVDANILFSALITPDGKIAKILSNPLSSAIFISGHLLVEELLRHQSKIVRYAKRNEQEVIENMHYLLKSITLYDETLTEQGNWLRADELTAGIDHFDISYVALSLQHDATLWTGDKKLAKHLKVNGFSNVMSTHELYEVLDIN